MSHWTTRAPWLALLLTTSAPAAVLAQSPSGADPAAPQQAPQKLCFKCKRTGKIPCTQHKPEEDVLFCSTYLTKPCCLGIGFTLCQKCNVEEAKEEWEELKQKRDKWLNVRQAIDKDVGVPLVHLESVHFRLDSGLPSVSTSDRRYDAHRGAHLYIDRLEAVWNLYVKILDVKKERADPKHEIVIFDTVEPFNRYLKKHIGLGGANIAGHTIRGDVYSRYVGWKNPSDTPDDAALHSRIVHKTAELLLRKYKTYHPEPPSWLEEGFCYYCEHTINKDMRTFCFVEVPPDSSWKHDDWREHVYKEVARKSNPSFADVSAKELNAMDYEDMAFSYSYVDFMITKDMASFRKFVDAIKAGKKTPDAIREVYGWLPVEFEDNWRTYVLQKYSG